MIVKHHWLYGDIHFNVDVQKEDSCARCIHFPVCKRSMRDFCLNYNFGTSERGASCDGCIHRHTRYTGAKDKILCFKCKHFKDKEKPWSVS